MSDTKHTPTPWLLDKWHENLLGANGKDIVVWGLGIAHGQRTEETEANAEFIVRACNSHDALVEACKQVFLLPRPWMAGSEIGWERWNGAFELIEAALRKAEGDDQQ